MTDCNCTFSHFDGPHDAEARHPNPKACIHAEDASKQLREAAIAFVDARGLARVPAEHALRFLVKVTRG